MIPNFHNVYGTVQAHEGLSRVLAVAKKVAPWRTAQIKRSVYGERLRLSSASADFDSEQLDSGEYLLKGAVAGTTDEVIALAREFSNELQKQGIVHHFEIYDSAQNLVAEIQPQKTI